MYQLVSQKKILMIVNPVSAGKQTGKEWPEFERLLKGNSINFDVKYTEYRGHATEITRKALENGYDLIVSVGGDGTMNEVVNGFFDNNTPIDTNACLAVFSRGTGCDFIKTIGIDKGIDAFLKILKTGNIKKLDVGEVRYEDYKKGNNTRYFLNISDLGLGGETTNRINKTAKSFKGFLSFLFNAIISIILYKNKHMEVIVDGKEVYNQRINSVMVANGKFFGGGMMIAPEAKLDDGEFDIVVLEDLSKLELIISFHLIYKGMHFNHPKVKLYKGKSVIVKSKEKVLLDIDGEQPGTTNAQFRIIDKTINVIV